MKRIPENAVTRAARDVFRSVPVRNAAFFSALAAILVLSLLPRAAVDATFSAEVQARDHAFHAFAYAALTALFLAARVKREAANAATRAAAFAVFTLLGGVLELLQATPFVNRSASWGDAAHNAAGAAAGALLPAFFLLRRAPPKRDVSA